MLSYIEINKENLIHNIKTIKSLLPKETLLVSVIKANAYGHDQNLIAQILEPHTNYFGVDDFVELEALRKVSNIPVIVLGYIEKEKINQALQFNATLGLYDLDRIQLVNTLSLQQNKCTKIHIKIDANLGRQGVLLNNLHNFVKELKKHSNIEIEALYSHFANIEDTSNQSHAMKQIKTFNKAVHIFRTNGFPNVKTHISASAGIIVHEFNGGSSDFARCGISLYGMWPSLALSDENSNIELKPVMKWITHIAQIKIVPSGYTIGYGLTHTTDHLTKIAVIPQGYSDGYDRGLSNIGEVLIKGSRCKILGRIAMNMFVVDITHLQEVYVEDQVVLLGDQSLDRISAEEIAGKIETINYEVTARISPLLPRVIV